MATSDQLHFQIDPQLKREFHSWCARQGRSMSEVGRLVIAALLEERVALEQLETDKETKTDGPQSTDRTV